MNHIEPSQAQKFWDMPPSQQEAWIQQWKRDGCPTVKRKGYDWESMDQEVKRHSQMRARWPRVRDTERKAKHENA